MTRLLALLSLLLLPPSLYAEEIAPGIYRTAEARFEGLADYPFSPNYMQIGKYRVHYLDEGPRDGEAILLLHGEPTWSYLYRKMIPLFTAAGYRVIAPDLVGFGKSDKAALESDYSYPMQVDSMLEFVTTLDLKNTTFFGQDWGGLIGLRVVAAAPDRFSHVVVSNTGMPAADGLAGMFGYTLFKLGVWWEGAVTYEELAADVSFLRWAAYSHNVDNLPVGDLMMFMGAGDGIKKAYEAPFPDKRYKAAVHAMPYLVPSQLQENEEAWKVFEAWDKPFLVAFTDSDPITAGGEQEFLNRVPTAQNVTIANAGHFVQEDAGDELAQLILRFMRGEQVAD
ncbi:MAG: haloalkane dehalogenase [Halioglobus sp.]|jgi:haloalkane dehalogenase